MGGNPVSRKFCAPQTSNANNGQGCDYSNAGTQNGWRVITRFVLLMAYSKHGLCGYLGYPCLMYCVLLTQ